MKLIVQQLDETQAFYEQAFGFEKINTIELDHMEERVMRLPGGGAWLILYHYKDGRTINIGNGHGPIGISTTDVDEFYNRALAAGAEPSREPMTLGSIRFAFVLDPEGHEIELADMPSELTGN